MYLSVALYRQKFDCDDLEDESDEMLEEYIAEAECYVETFVQQGGYSLPLTDKQALFLRTCIADRARFLWANTDARCTDVIVAGNKACLTLLNDIKERECLLPEDKPTSNGACFAVVDLCRA